MPSSPAFRAARTLVSSTQEPLLSKIAELYDRLAMTEERAETLEQKNLELEDALRALRKELH